MASDFNTSNQLGRKAEEYIRDTFIPFGLKPRYKNECEEMTSARAKIFEYGNSIEETTKQHQGLDGYIILKILEKEYNIPYQVKGRLFKIKEYDDIMLSIYDKYKNGYKHLDNSYTLKGFLWYVVFVNIPGIKKKKVYNINNIKQESFTRFFKNLQNTINSSDRIEKMVDFCIKHDIEDYTNFIYDGITFRILIKKSTGNNGQTWWSPSVIVPWNILINKYKVDVLLYTEINQNGKISFDCNKMICLNEENKEPTLF